MQHSRALPIHMTIGATHVALLQSRSRLPSALAAHMQCILHICALLHIANQASIDLASHITMTCIGAEGKGLL